MDKIDGTRPVEISVSVVSHLQIALIAELLSDLEKHCNNAPIELILTLNVDEELPFSIESFSWPIKLIRNHVRMGFGANHNQAFRNSSGRFFCVVNPDIRLIANPFPELLQCLEKMGVGLVAPLVLGADGEMQDSSRRFPTPLKIAHKTMGRDSQPDYLVGDQIVYPDWVGGMFMVYPADIFKRLHGFDERYFMYYEDVDICARLRLMDYQVAICPEVAVTHHARRDSHRSFRYFRWHLQSMSRFFLSPVYRQLRRRVRR
jgi:N-acetylglucosaminyl-diphospho-decaprenol L-rhamnosyltransferase